MPKKIFSANSLSRENEIDLFLDYCQIGSVEHKVLCQLQSVTVIVIRMFIFFAFSPYNTPFFTPI